jgi:hypothetical protein
MFGGAVLGLLKRLQGRVLGDRRNLHRILARHGVALSAGSDGGRLGKGGLLPRRLGLLERLQRSVLGDGGYLLRLLAGHGSRA